MLQPRILPPNKAATGGNRQHASRQCLAGVGQLGHAVGDDREFQRQIHKRHLVFEFAFHAHRITAADGLEPLHCADHLARVHARIGENRHLAAEERVRLVFVTQAGETRGRRGLRTHDVPQCLRERALSRAGRSGHQHDFLVVIGLSHAIAKPLLQLADRFHPLIIFAKDFA